MGIKLSVAGSSKMKGKKKNADGSMDLVGDGKSIIKTLIREIGLPAAIGLIAAAIASVWIKREQNGKFGPMFALTAVALAWGVPRFLLRGFRIPFLDKKTAERAGAFAVAFAVGWDNVINPIIGNDPNHIVARLVKWAQKLVTKDPNAIAQAAAGPGGNNYGGGGADEFSYQTGGGGGGTSSGTSSSGGSSGGGGGGSSGGGDQTASYIAAGGQAIGAILSGIGDLAKGFGGGSTPATDTSGMAGPGVYRSLARRS
ncbi:MAG: hypothetical protein ICCCNLDF_02815 [Planctomycetes bacterium]|nr:hypothetical protein [Planctomycetota bacterium]